MPVQLRQVVLWGRVVDVDDSDRVWCPGWWQLIPAVELGQVDNSHSVGLPNRAAGRLQPVREGRGTSKSAPWSGWF
jgi:hypothetical protein